MDATLVSRDLRHALSRAVLESNTPPSGGVRPTLWAMLPSIAGDGLPRAQAEGIVEELAQEVHAFGPLWPWAFDRDVSEIMVNGPGRVFVEQDGRKRQIPTRFRDADHLRAIIDRLRALDPGHRLDSSKPFADLSLPDGSRVNAVIAPIAHDGPHLTIRCYRGRFNSLEDLIEQGSMDGRMAILLDAAVRARMNILFSGGTATGKTTLLEILSRSIPEQERIVVIEETLELKIVHSNVLRLLTRECNIEGRGQITIGDLFRNALRMAPDRILLGEVRGGEAYDLLQALNSGHRGSLAVMHASSPEEAIARFENLVPLANLGLPPSVVKRQIAHGLDLLVQLHQLPDGSRRVTRISEVNGVDALGDPALTDLFRFVPEVDAASPYAGWFECCVEAPAALGRLRMAVPDLPDDLFGVDTAA